MTPRARVLIASAAVLVVVVGGVCAYSLRGPRAHPTSTLAVDAEPTSAALSPLPEVTTLPSVSPPPSPPSLPSTPARVLVPTRAVPTLVATARPGPTTAAALTEEQMHDLYCRTASHTEGAVVETLEICLFPGGDNDMTTLTFGYTGDRVMRTLHVDYGDGYTNPNETVFRYECSNNDRPNPLHHGAVNHEFASGHHVVTATTHGHSCGNSHIEGGMQSDPDYDDTDRPVSGTVSLAFDKP